MADSSAPRPPARRLDRASLERVLARAAELQSATGETPEEFSEDQLLELGREVGLSPQNLRQALAEERTRSVVVADERGLRAAVFGPSHVHAERTVPGKPDDVLAAIDVWMQRQELLVVKRHLAERIVWEPHRGVLMDVKRALRVGGRDYALSRAFEVSATVISVDDNRVHVGLEGDFRNLLNSSTIQGVASGVFGAAAGGVLGVLGIGAAIGMGLVVAAAPVVAGVGIGVTAARATQHRVVTRAQLALEQLLDRLERAEISGRGTAESLLGAILSAASGSLPPRRF